MKQLAIVGGGFMGAALAEGLIDSGWDRGALIVAEMRVERRRFLRNELGLTTTPDAAEAVRGAESVLFAIKPQEIDRALASAAPAFDRKKLAISICAGVRIATIERALDDPPVMRAMPNTPAAIGIGATALARGRHATDAHLARALNILGTVGKVVLVDEAQMDAVTAISGTGPAYVFYLAQILIEAAQDQGLSREQAYVLVYQTFVGASRMLMHDPADPAQLRAQVTSAGGTTEAAVAHLQTNRWAEIFKEAVDRARQRSEELGV